MHVQPILDVCFCPKGFFFASGGADKIVYLWCSNKKAPLKSFKGHLKEVTQVGFTMNMIYLISASADHSVRLWNIKETAMVRVFYAHSQITKYFSFIRDLFPDRQIRQCQLLAIYFALV